MFKHSIKVPRLYKTAANITEQVREKGGSIKSLVFQGKHPNTKAIYALVLETLQHGREIDYILSQSGLLVKEERFNPWLAKVLITELLWGKKRLAGESKPIQTVLAYYDTLKLHLASVPPRLKYDVTQKVNKPRYVRVNTIYLSIEDAIYGFENEGRRLVQNDFKDYGNFLDAVKTLQEDQFMVDFHLEEVLIFPYKTDLLSHECYLNGSIILQDKASCLPVHLLNPEPGSTILDMCAAPGMKTSQLAARLNNNCTIYAVEKDEGRYNTLCSLMENLGVTCVTPIHANAAEVDEKRCPNVDYILLDPSCSGSGKAHFDLESSDSIDNKRLFNLHWFQYKLLSHALSSFNAKRIVYSTCSVFPSENEEVVQAVLKKNTSYKLVNAGDLLGGHWNSFGDERYQGIGPKCVYARPKTDYCNGFFVAVFEKCDEASGGVETQQMEEDLQKCVAEGETPMQHEKRSRSESSEAVNVKFELELDAPFVEGGLVKRKKKRVSEVDVDEDVTEKIEHDSDDGNLGETPVVKKEKNSKKDVEEEVYEVEEAADENSEEKPAKKRKKSKKDAGEADVREDVIVKIEPDSGDENSEEKPTKKRKKSKKDAGEVDVHEDVTVKIEQDSVDDNSEEKPVKKKKKSKKDAEEVYEEEIVTMKKIKRKTTKMDEDPDNSDVKAKQENGNCGDLEEKRLRKLEKKERRKRKTIKEEDQPSI